MSDSDLELSANLGFLWTDRPLVDAIHAASSAGFDAVEFHGPYDTPAAEVAAALAATGLHLCSLNTPTGNDGEVGVAALPGREADAHHYIDEAVEYAAAVGCRAVSVVAGISGRTDEAEATYRQNLTYAADLAAPLGITVLIEPLNTGVSDGYHLVSADAGVETIDAVGADNLKLMLDTFHTSVMHGALEPVIERVVEYLGHVQFASIPDRAEPDGGDVDYRQLLPWIRDKGYSGPFGAEYNPAGSVEDGLGWMRTLRGEQ